MVDPLEALREKVGRAGEVNSVYGGFEIKVLKPELFPWHRIFEQLIGIGQRIWVEKKEGGLYIVSEPRVQ